MKASDFHSSSLPRMGQSFTCNDRSPWPQAPFVKGTSSSRNVKNHSNFLSIQIPFFPSPSEASSSEQGQTSQSIHQKCKSETQNSLPSSIPRAKPGGILHHHYNLLFLSMATATGSLIISVSINISSFWQQFSKGTILSRQKLCWNCYYFQRSEHLRGFGTGMCQAVLITNKLLHFWNLM